MANLKKYDLEGNEVGEVSIDDNLLAAKTNTQMIKDCLVALKNNQRQWSANTKVRSEIHHTKTKPHPQKGTGRARQGFLGAPQYKGGFIVFGPRPKFNQHVHVNRKEKRAAICQLLTEMVREGKATVLQSDGIEAPKTQVIAKFLKNSKIPSKRTLFLGKAEDTGKVQSFALSTRNMPRIGFKYLSTINAYDLTLNQQVVIMEPALEQLIELLKQGAKS